MATEQPAADTQRGSGKDAPAKLAGILADVSSSNAALWREHMQLAEVHARLERDFVKLSERFRTLVAAHEAVAGRLEALELSARDQAASAYELHGPLFRRPAQRQRQMARLPDIPPPHAPPRPVGKH